MQIFTYGEFDEKLEKVKGKSLASAYKRKCGAQSIYKELTKHAKNSAITHSSLCKRQTFAFLPSSL
jgi:hypothetical protein